MSNPWPYQKNAESFYGDPDITQNGVPDRRWEDANLTRIVPPWTMVLAWKPAITLKSILIHKKCAPSLSRVLGVIWAHAGNSQDGIERLRMHFFSGSYVFRLTRGGNSLSMHSYGCAIDFDHTNNAMGKQWLPNSEMMPTSVIEAFNGEGWSWGGLFKRPDAMHFQAIRLR